ncbi:xylose repressor [Actinoplanes lobatus]|uniref:Putative NBD/HSP70 family sugar kinase n=1 Tax=Actinoplanes lobatus TaxID=113568 RepID=A0A7W7MK26_9ACTN|nr:ROK family transcriptional regulator [Actinoplanes lobatus]MBB4752610.1 putative NBD/HSP70 family sugar kinase [Actinoplanes lobatus]GGN93571.1 xylose repressor [Actinoplanes lobatus]GIE44724.1 xylose repressor [Actinoplanes lobatus]
MTLPARRAGSGFLAPARQENVRAHNLGLILQQIAADTTPVSRIELARATGLARPTVSRLVDDLLAGGLIAEVGPDRSRSTGRPPIGLTLSRSGPAGLGLDIRTGSLAACIVDFAGTVRHLEFAARPHPVTSPEQTIDDLAAIAEGAISTAEAQGLTVAGVTLAAPGPVQDRSRARFAPAIGWRDFDAGSRLRAALGSHDVIVSVENEAGLAALAEWHASDKELRNFVCLFGDFELGAGIVLDGELLRGARGWSGELGHVTVEPDGVACSCGAKGCLQGYSGLAAILAAVPDDEQQAGAASHQTPAVTIGVLADRSPQVRSALDRAGTALGISLAALINLIDVDTVLLDGSYSLLATWLTEQIQTQIRDRVLTARWAPIEVRAAPIGPDAAVIGAALTVIDDVRRDPSTWITRTGS